MAMQIAGQVGPSASNAGDGAALIPRLGRSGDVIVSEFQPRYYEAAVRGQGFNGANQAAQAVSAALATTYTGLLLFNPPNSGKNIVPLRFKFALSAAPVAIATIGLIQGYAATGGVTVQTTKLAAASNIIGGPAGVGIVLSAATIVPPTWLTHFYDGFTAGALPGPSAPVDLEGKYIIPPGGFIAVGALTAITGLGSISWIENSV